MGRIAVTRTIRFLPGKRQQYLDHLKAADALRAKWGMSDSLIMEKAIDPEVILVIQIWDDVERYEAWSKSQERSKVMAEGRHLRVREPTVMYRVLE